MSTPDTDVLTDEQDTAWWEPGAGCDQPTIVIEWTPGPVRIEVAVQPGVDFDDITGRICAALNDCLNYEPDDFVDNTPVQIWNEATSLPQRAMIVRVECSGSVQRWERAGLSDD